MRQKLFFYWRSIENMSNVINLSYIENEQYIKFCALNILYIYLDRKEFKLMASAP